MRDSEVLSRRTLLAGGTVLAALAATRSLSQSQSNRSDERFSPLRSFDTKRRLLIKGGTIISMDARIRDWARGDVLIEGSKITQVGANIAAAGAQLMDASNMIVIPGFVDCHRHS